ncbi:unnamed protein product [Rotaria socialis]|uniref:C2H2-type domain-containing protein n=1 Tax=Rotaria socialis TaxID=392032 RepID=A0A818HKM8_9BILA|nr:unnamed protein product [Rotaria socialis]CAF3626001.1 unnamed protein product [Rotaria socialis]CAF4544141.1 unnamed protein product [Rotaria socialis]
MNWNHLRDTLIDELAVEGLDGCTFDHLYSIVKPLFISLNNQLSTDTYLRSYIWKILLSCSCIELYELPENFQAVLSSNDLAIENSELNHRGYSSTYNQRKLLSNKSDYLILDNISNVDRMHLVVEQNIREFRITQGRFDTKQLFSKYEYALLECICKTRSKGIPTSGNDGLSKIFNINSKSLFYYLKQLISLDIIKKLNLTRQLVGTLKQPILIMTRYITTNDYLNSKYTIIDRLKTYLEQCKNQSCERNHLKSYLSLGEKSFRSLMRKCKRLNLIEKYNKTMSEHDLKKFINNEDDSISLICINNRTRLRSYTFFRLKSNNISKDDDEEIASSSEDNEQTEDEDEDEVEDDTMLAGGDDEDSDMFPLSEASSLLDQKHLRLYVDRPFHFQYYQLLEQVKDIGLSQRDLANICHLSFYSARSEIKSLTKNMKHISLKSVQLNQKGKIMENRIVLKKYMPTAATKATPSSSTTTTNINIRQQIISKTPRAKRKKSNRTPKEIVQTAAIAESPSSSQASPSNPASLIKCEPLDAEHLDNEPLLSRLVSSEILWRPSIQTVPAEPPKKKSKTRVNPVKRINIKREHRLDLIRSYMQEHPICTLTDLRAAIMSSEREEGLTIHMDRKTLDKLVDELEKIHKFLFRFTARVKQSRTIICLAMNTDDIAPNCERIQQFKIELSQETIEVPSTTQTKSKTISQQRLSNTTTTTTTAAATTTDQLDQTVEEEKPLGVDSKITIDNLFNNGLEEEKIALLKKKPLENITGFGNCYGYVYKFQRCAILHKFLFYLIYGYEGKVDTEPLESTIDMDQPLVSNDPEVQSILDSIPNARRYIGSNQGANWKTFVPPLDTRGRSIPAGCLYLDDFLMCMPVSIFLAVVYVPYKVPGLMELLSHPTKRYILVRDLPAEMRYPLVVRRHYLYRIAEVLKYLSTLGLITFVDRPIISRLEKLNTLIYIHPKAYLINTINQTNNSNEPIENMPNYPKQNYHFISLTNVNRFWFDLIEIALNTYRIKIFSRKQNRSHIVDILKQANKPIPIENISEVKTPLGKSNGPAGFDYDLYLFLRKSWKLPYNNKRILKLLNREANHCCIPVCELRVPIDVALKRSYTRHLAQKRKNNIRKRGMNMLVSNFDTELNSSFPTPLSSSTFHRTKRSLNVSIKPSHGFENYGHLSRYIIPYDSLNQLQFIDRRKKLLFQYIREKNKTILNRFNDILRDTSVKNVNPRNNKKKRKLNEEQESDDEEQVNSTALRVRWSPIEERVISLINASLSFYLPRKQPNTPDISQDSNPIGSRRPAAFLPFNKELFRACLIRILPRSARSKTPQNVVRKIKNDMSQQTRISQLEHLSVLCSTDTFLLSFRNESKRYLKQRYRSNEHFFLLLFERIYMKFQNFIRTGYLHCIPQGTIEYLPNTRDELLKQYKIIGKPSVELQASNPSESTKSILSSTISMAAHSSLLSNERSGTTKAFILHYIFSQYPESLLNEIVYRLMHTDAVITLTKSNDIQRKITSEASTFLAGRAYHINQRYIYRWYTYMPAIVLHETYSWINENILSKININDIRDEMIVTIDIEQQNNVAIAASFITFFDSNHFDIQLALPKSLDNEPEMIMSKMHKNENDDESNTDDDDNNDDDHERVFEQVLQSARRIDQTRYENINKRKLSTDNENSNKKPRLTTDENDVSSSRTKSSTSNRHQCSECSKSFINRTSLVRHRHRQHEKHHQVKSGKTALRPGSTTQNPLGRGRHATDTSSLSCCSIKFVLSTEFLQEQYQHFFMQKSLYTIDKLIERFPLYSAVYDQEQQIDYNENNLLYHTILNTHEFGLTFYQIYNQVKSTMTFSECVKQLNDYLTRGIIIAGGSRTRIYVHRKHARSWLIYSIRFRQHDNNNNLETLLTSAFADSTPAMANIDNDTTQDSRQIKSLNLPNSENILNKNGQLISDQFERVVFIPRPWKSTDGSINFVVLQRMMESLLLYIIDHPGTNLEHIYEHYKCVLQPVAINDCIELFQQMNCLETVQVPLKKTIEKQINLYSNEHSDDEHDDEHEKNQNIQYDSDNDFERILFKANYDYQQTTLYCFPTYDCLAKFGVSFPSSLMNQQRGIDRMPFPSY